jgi:hypothetical protein
MTGFLKAFFKLLTDGTTNFHLRNSELRYAEQVNAVEVEALEGLPRRVSVPGLAMADVRPRSRARRTFAEWLRL